MAQAKKRWFFTEFSSCFLVPPSRPAGLRGQLQKADLSGPGALRGGHGAGLSGAGDRPSDAHGPGCGQVRGALRGPGGRGGQPRLDPFIVVFQIQNAGAAPDHHGEEGDQADQGSGQRQTKQPAEQLFQTGGVPTGRPSLFPPLRPGLSAFFDSFCPGRSAGLGSLRPLLLSLRRFLSFLFIHAFSLSGMFRPQGALFRAAR